MIIKKPASWQPEKDFADRFDDLMDSRWAWAIRSCLGWVMTGACVWTWHLWWAMAAVIYAGWAAFQKPVDTSLPKRADSASVNRNRFTFGGGPG